MKVKLNKKITILAIILSVIGLVFYLSQINKKQDLRSSASTLPDRVDITLETAQNQVNPQTQFNVDLFIDCGDLSCSGAHFTIEFDTSKLRGVELTNAGALPQNLIVPKVNNNQMSATFGAAIGNTLHGRHKIATAVFETLNQTGTTSIRLLNNGTSEPEIVTTEHLTGDTNRTYFNGIQPLNIGIGSDGPNEPTQSDQLEGDCNGDGQITSSDFTELFSRFNTRSVVRDRCDFNGDGLVGLSDFAAVIRNFASQNPQPTQTQITQPPTTQPQPSGLEFEAESGQITAPFQSSGGRVFQTTRNTSGIAGGGELHFNVNIPKTGNYILQGYVCAQSIDQNSVYFNFDAHPSGNAQSWIFNPTGSSCGWQNANWRGNGSAESPAINPAVFSLNQGQHDLHIHGREPEAGMDKFRIVEAGINVPTLEPEPTSRPTPTRTPNPTSGPNPTSVPTPTLRPPTSGPNPTAGPTSQPVPTGQTGSKIYPNCPPGYIPADYQGWSQKLSNINRPLDYLMSDAGTSCLSHWHIAYCVPNTCGGETQVTSNQDMPVTFTTYNDNSLFNMFRIQNQGDTYFENKSPGWPRCQNGPDEGKQCTQNFTVPLRADDFKSSTEIRTTTNTNDSPSSCEDPRWYLSTNFLTSVGYRGPNCQAYTRNECKGEYTRNVIKNYDQIFNGPDPIPSYRGVVPIQIGTSGGKGDIKKYRIYEDPAQHVGCGQPISGTTLLDYNGDFNGTFNYNCAERPAGIHKILFISVQGKTGGNGYVDASGLALMINCIR